MILLESAQAPVRLRENANDLLTIPPLSVPTMLSNQVGHDNCDDSTSSNGDGDGDGGGGGDGDGDGDGACIYWSANSEEPTRSAIVSCWVACHSKEEN